MLKLYSAALLISLLFFGVSSSDGASHQSVAIWYIVNKSADKNYDYLETVFPESLAVSIGNNSPLVVSAPASVENELYEEKVSLKKSCSPSRAREMAEKIKTDFFVYGEFVPVKKNNIKTTLRIYSRKADTFFTFNETIVIAAEIFPFVDKITSVIINYVLRNGQYIADVIPERRKLAFITGISDTEIHELYLSFMRAGYRVSFIQNNSFNNKIDDRSIMSFFYITTKHNSYNSALIEEDCTSEAPQGCFADKEDDSLKRLYYSVDGDVDCLIIIGFNNKRRKSAWVRGIDLKNRNLIWIQPEITGSSIYEISNKIVTHMQTPPPDPFTDKNIGDD